MVAYLQCLTEDFHLLASSGSNQRTICDAPESPASINGLLYVAPSLSQSLQVLDEVENEHSISFRLA